MFIRLHQRQKKNLPLTMEDFEQLQLQNTFSSRDVIMNFHNNRTWEDENLNAINKSRHQYQFSVNVWVVIVADPLI